MTLCHLCLREGTREIALADTEDCGPCDQTGRRGWSGGAHPQTGGRKGGYFRPERQFIVTNSKETEVGQGAIRKNGSGCSKSGSGADAGHTRAICAAFSAFAVASSAGGIFWACVKAATASSKWRACMRFSGRPEDRAAELLLRAFPRASICFDGPAT